MKESVVQIAKWVGKLQIKGMGFGSWNCQERFFDFEESERKAIEGKGTEARRIKSAWQTSKAELAALAEKQDIIQVALEPAILWLGTMEFTGSQKL